jgi:hypothetical protein
MDEGVMGSRETLELVAPFLDKAVVTELCSGRRWADYRERKLELLRHRIARAWWRQRQLAKRERAKETRFVDGIGQRKAVIDEELVAFTRSKYGRLAFHDPDHLNYILKEHPELRVPTPKPRYLMVNGFKDRRPQTVWEATVDYLKLKHSRRVEGGGAGDGARGDPATALKALADRQAPGLRAGSAHEIPAPPLPLPYKSQNTGET